MAALSHTAREQKRCWTSCFPAPNSPLPQPAPLGSGVPCWGLHPAGGLVCVTWQLVSMSSGKIDRQAAQAGPSPCFAGLTWPPRGALSAHSLLSHQANLSLFSRVPVSFLPPSCLSPQALSLPCLQLASHTWSRSLLKAAGTIIPGEFPSLGLSQSGTAAPVGGREKECGSGQESCG